MKELSEHKQVEESPIAVHQQLLDIVEFLPDATFVIDIHKKVIAWNKAMELMTGISKQDIIGKGDYIYAKPFYGSSRPILIDYFFLNDPKLEQKYEHVEKKENVIFAEVYVPLVFNGKGAFVWATASPLFDKNGILVGAIETIRDITERKESEEKYRSLFENSKDVVFITTKDGSIIDMNRAAIDLFGYSRVELLQMKIITLYNNPSNRERYVELMEKQGFVKDYPVDLKAKDGNILNILITSVLQKKGNNGHFQYQGIMRDITEYKKAEKALDNAHMQIKQLMSSISSVLIGVAPNDRIIQWNNAAEKLFGITANDVVGRTFAESGIQWDWDKITEFISECGENKHSVPNEIIYTRPDGKNGIFSFSLTPVGSDTCYESGYVLLGNEISEQKKFEAQRALSQKMESIGQLAAGIAHEINTPMQYIGDNVKFLSDAFGDISDLLEKYNDFVMAVEEKKEIVDLSDNIRKLEEELDLDYLISEIPKAISQSLDGIARVSKLVLAMKDFSHPGRKDKMFSDINKAINGTVTISRNEWKYVAELETDLDQNLPMVYCVIDEINQVILNMIVNAAHAIRDVLDKGSELKGKIIIKTISEDSFVKIIINDTGTGIPEAVLHKIFDPFYTTKEVGKGTGQGLAIAHDIIINKHKGSIGVDSEVGKGTTITISLPLNIEPVNEVID